MTAAHTLIIHKAMFTVVSARVTSLVYLTPNTQWEVWQALCMNWFFFLFDWFHAK